MNTNVTAQPRHSFTTLVVCLAVLTLGACSSGPKEQFESCRDRVTNGASLEQSSDCFTKRSQSFLLSLERAEAESEGTLNYLADRDQLLDVELDPDVNADISGRLAILQTLDDQPVMMIQEDGDWRIDALELARFWVPLKEAWETE